MKVVNEWVDFSVTNSHESLTYTKEQFEGIVGDKFLAVRVDEKNVPQLIWTTNFVCPLKFEVLDEHDPPVLVYRRNPDTTTATIEQVMGAYDDRVEDIESLEKTINEIRLAYTNGSGNELDELLHDLFTNQLVEDY